MRTCGVVAALGGALALVGAPTAPAATFNVNSTADSGGNCKVPGPCTLRQAILDAKEASSPGPDTINVPPGDYQLTGQDLIIAIGERVSIVGTDPRTTIIREVSGGDQRVFLVEQNAVLELTGLTLTGAKASAVLMFGGGNTVRATRVTFAGNEGVQGGAVNVGGGTLALDGSTLSGNRAVGGMGQDSRGGAIYATGAATPVSLTNSTASGNAAGAGNAFYVTNSASLDLGFSTVGGNTNLSGAVGAGGEVVLSGATGRTGSSILAGCQGQFTSLGNNVDAGQACFSPVAGDRTATDPRLGPLQNNGGPTDTRALGAGSPAIDAAGPCPPPASDQRGVTRPQGPRCDVGAFEAPVTVPQIVGLAVKRSPFAAAGAGPQVMRVPNRRLGFGSTVFYRINLLARVAFVVDRASTGRREGNQCLPRSRFDVTSTGCRRYIRQAGSIDLTVLAGYNSFYLRGRLMGRSLSRGNYRLLATPNANAQTGPPASVKFAIR
jgi:hypothetical protein